MTQVPLRNPGARRLKLRSVRIRPDTGKPSGFLWHYGHFIHDLVLPLNDWLASQGQDVVPTVLLIEDTPEQSVGRLLGLIPPLLGIDAELLRSEDFHRADGETLVLEAYLFGPYSTATLRNVERRIWPRFDLAPSADGTPEILLIERSTKTHGFEDHPGLPPFASQTGSQRRSLLNHREIADLLHDRYGPRFRNVVLEDLPLVVQARLFHHARLVIGQHGAGLNNLIWMPDGAGTLIEITPSDIPTFDNLCRAKGLRHLTLGPRHRQHVHLDPGELVAALERWERAGAEFGP